GQQGDLVQAKSQTLDGCLRFRFRGSGGVGPRLRRQGLQTHSYHRDSDTSSIFERHSVCPPPRESVHQAGSAINGPVVVAAIAAANRGYKPGSTNSAHIAEVTKPPRITTAAGRRISSPATLPSATKARTIAPVVLVLATTGSRRSSTPRNTG